MEQQHQDRTNEELLIRISERVEYLTSAVTELRCDLHNRFVTKEMCMLKQAEHDHNNSLARAESIAKVAVLISIAVSIVWAVVKHG